MNDVCPEKSNADKELNLDTSQVCEPSEPDLYLFSHSTSYKDGWRAGEGDSRPLFLLLTFQASILRHSHGSSICPAVIPITHFLILQFLLLSFWSLDTTVYSMHQGNTGPQHGHGLSQIPMLESHLLDISLQRVWQRYSSARTWQSGFVALF